MLLTEHPPLCLQHLPEKRFRLLILTSNILDGGQIVHARNRVWVLLPQRLLLDLLYLAKQGFGLFISTLFENGDRQRGHRVERLLVLLTMDTTHGHQQ